MNKEIPRRGPGRPKKAIRKDRITITLLLETIQYVDSQSENRSEFIEQCIAEHRKHSIHKEN